MANADIPQAYGIAMWIIVLIGVGGAMIITIILGIVSALARRTILKRHRRVVFDVFPAGSPIVPRGPAPQPPQPYQPVVVGGGGDGEVIANVSTIEVEIGSSTGGATTNGVPMQSMPPRPPPKPRHVRPAFTAAASSRRSSDAQSHIEARPGWKTQSGVPLLDVADGFGQADLVNETSETPGGESAEQARYASPSAAAGVQMRKMSPRKAEESIVQARQSRYNREIMLDSTPQEKEIDDEFKKLPVVRVDSKHLPADAYVKNRYSSVLPSPDTLVPLHGSGYINANFVRGFDGNPNKYIATQAPMENTVDDFWLMVLDHNVTVIVMVTYLFEYGVEKCIQYWPDKGAMRYGNVEVSNSEELHKEHYIRTTLRVKTNQGSRTVKHYAFTGWPEHGMPRTSVGVRSFMRDIDGDVQESEGNGTILVHCSAGVGRTGVVIAIDIGMKKIERGLPVDVADIVSHLRVDRPGAVQTRSQYRFIYRALREHMEQEATANV
ncbi:tyrosine-protein phosphatase non-receptor type 7-like [Oscarella lobularis]|uniref:tyrosine-protein phosphatase non-receptor type 7-like n=1 Tax=Oscarella lobularis TaxID=121494 RepID=UPI0033137C6D